MTADAARLSVAAAPMFESTFGAANTPEDMDASLTTAFTTDRQRDEASLPAWAGLCSLVPRAEGEKARQGRNS